MSIPKHESYAYSHQDKPAEYAVFDTGEQRKPGHILSYTNGKRIKHGTCKSHMSSDIDHTYTYEIIISERSCQWNDNCNKSDSLFTHSEHSSEDSEQQHDEGYHDITHTKLVHQRITLQLLHLSDELQDAIVHRLSTVHHPEGTTDNQYKGNDACLLAEALV